MWKRISEYGVYNLALLSLDRVLRFYLYLRQSLRYQWRGEISYCSKLWWSFPLAY